ncbi:mechanosensitive ion channel, partial [Candidatus Woesearchaeota archaeon]|nr:mechanosensitive ion channel [Candidatus Woesearchaeota archaeon]
MAFLEITFWGNTVASYLWVLIILAVTYLGVRVAYFIVAKVIGALTKKTKTRLDDLLVEALRAPIVLAVFLVGIKYAENALVLSAGFERVYSKIIIVLWVFDVAWFIARLVDSILANYIQPLTQSSKSKMDDTLYPVLKVLINFIIYAIAATVMLQNLGIEITGLMAGLGLGGLAFALAAQDLLSNTFAGGAIIFDKPFKVGDRLKVEGYDGFVKKISMRTTTMETFGKTQIIMPNSRIANNVVENVSREDRRRELVVLGVEYGTSTKKMKKAKELLHKIVLKNDKTDDDSLVHFIAFGPTSLDIQLIYYIKDMDQILA